MTSTRAASPGVSTSRASLQRRVVEAQLAGLVAVEEVLDVDEDRRAHLLLKVLEADGPEDVMAVD